MPEPQVTDPVAPGNPPAAEPTGKDSSLLTGKTPAAEGTTTPLAEGAASEAPKWMAQLPDDLKSSKGLTKFANIGDLGKSYLELEGKLGNAVTVPGLQATDEERARYRKAIGVPDKPTDYKIDKVKLPNGVFEKLNDTILEIAHTSGLTPDQAKAVHATVFKEIATTMKESLKLVKATATETETQLRKEAGAGYDAMAADWTRGISFFDDEAKEIFKRSGIGNHPGILRGFAKIGRSMGEHKFVDGKPAGVGEVKSLEELMYGNSMAK